MSTDGRRTLLAVLILVSSIAPSVGQDGASPQSPASPPVTRQPGDDELKPANPEKPIDDKHTEALAWYMKGVEAQQNNNPQAALEAFEKASQADPSAADPVRARALLLLQSGQVPQGLDLARRAIRLDEGDFRTRFQLATILLRQPNVKTIRESIELLNQAVASDRLQRTDPEFILIHGVRGRLLLQLGQQQEAAKSYAVLLQALERPEDFDLDFRQHKALMDDRMTGYESVGQAMLAVGRTAEAVRAFEALVSIKQGTAGRHNLLLAKARYLSDDLEDAETQLNLYFGTGRRERDSLELLTQLYGSTERSSKLIDRLKELQTDTPDATTVKLYLADTQLKQGRLDEAATTYKDVIFESGDPAGYPGLIRVDIVRADADSFVRTLQKALRARVQLQEISPFLAEIVNDQEFAQAIVDACLKAVEDKVSLFPEVTWICAQIAQEIQISDELGRLLQATLDANPNQDLGQRTREQLGLHYLMNERAQDSAEQFRRLLSLRSLSKERRVQALRYLAIAEAYSDRFAEALQAIQAALSISPQNPDLLYRLGWIHFLNDNPGDAKEALGSSIDRSPGGSPTQNDARMILAAIYSKAEEWDNCIRQYKQVIANSGQDQDRQRRARLSLSAVYVERGDNPAAEQVLEELLQEQPDDPGVNNDLGYLYADQDKNLEKALSMIELAVAAEPDNRAYLDSLGWVLYRLERYEEALEALMKANSDPDFQDATLQEHLGDVYDALGRTEEAIESWRKALATEQESETPKEAVIERLKSRLMPEEEQTTPDSEETETSNEEESVTPKEETPSESPEPEPAAD